MSGENRMSGPESLIEFRDRIEVVPEHGWWLTILALVAPPIAFAVIIGWLS